MYVQLFVAATLLALGAMLFSRFELYTPAWRNVLKLVLFLGGTALISRYAGAVWAWVWIFGTLALGISVHVWWTRSHGIGVFSAEPRDRYYALRGWSKHI
jgi:hypothetical protein